MPGFVLWVRESEDGDPAMRLGITVTKKIGGAVVRNRMKRRFRALAREILPEQGFAGAHHILIVRAGGIERDFPALNAEFSKALAKLLRCSASSSSPLRPVGSWCHRCPSSHPPATLHAARPMHSPPFTPSGPI